VTDEPEAVQKVLEQQVATSDLVLITGGISAGDYDYVAGALAQCGVEQLFHKVKQKPGKPLYFGKKGQILVFGLPGNPASVLTCFYEYVTVALQIQVGLPGSGLPVRHLPLAADCAKKGGLTHFLKGVCSGDEVMPLGAQESYRLRSFALSDCLIVLQEDKSLYKKGETVEVHLIPV
jgi:molybdopterin molybdotransferase